jgi:hypothetical protein
VTRFWFDVWTGSAAAFGAMLSVGTGQDWLLSMALLSYAIVCAIDVHRWRQ